MKRLKAGESFPRFYVRVYMKSIALSERLGAVAKFIKQGAAVADVGTDHGYIPVFLAQNKSARHIIASDVKEGPLARARLSAAEYGVSDRIEFVQTDGLDGLESLGLDTIVIAGMGGETIAAILEMAPWTRTNNVRLILQPQSKLGELCIWLDNNGYAIFDAALAEDDGRIYTVLLIGAGETGEPSGAEIHANRILMEKRDPLLPRYLDMLIAKTKKTIEGMDQARNSVRIDALMHQKRALEGFVRMKEETEKW